MGKINNYDFGGGGNNRVKNPLQLADNELTQSQNAELIPDEAKGGEGALSKRGGLSALTTALAGAISGLGTLPLQTTYTRYLYVSLQNADADRFLSSTDGTTFVATSSPLLAMDEDAYGGGIKAGGLRMGTFGKALYYPGDDISASLGPALQSWDGTNAFTVGRIPTGPSSDGTACLSIGDVLVANGKVYFTVFDPPASTPNARGRVLSFNPNTGQMKQICEAFGTAPFMTAGQPISLAFYNGQLWAGLDDRAAGAGKVVRCYPDVDETWTVDTAALDGPVYSLESYRGNLYAAQFKGGANALISVRTASTGLWTTSYTGSAVANAYIKGLTVFNDELYAVEHATTPLVHVKKFDGSSWTTDRDMDSSDGAVAGNFPEGLLVFNSALFVAVRATTSSAADGFVMKRTTAGVWSKIVAAENIGGYLGELVTRSS